MKSLKHVLIVTTVFLAGILSTHAVILVNDTWADGNRTTQNLPTDSRWFTTQAALASVGVGYMSLTNRDTQSSEWTTYFTPSGQPSPLGVGDVLTVTVEFSVTGMPTATNTSQNFRIGLVDSTAGARVTADGGSAQIVPTGYAGYALFMNFDSLMSRPSGVFDLKWRAFTNTSTTLLGTAGDWSTIGTVGGSVQGTQGFTNNGQYTLTITLSRSNSTSVTLSAALSGGGLTNALTVTDPFGVITNFDCLNIRPSGASTTATNFIFTRFKVEGPSGAPQPPNFVNQPQSLTRVEGTYGQFNALANGATRYQWFTNSLTPVALTGATNSILPLYHIRANQAGEYFVIASNSVGGATSQVANLTVNPEIFTSAGVIVDDRWSDGDRITGPVGISNAVWFSSVSTSLVASVGSMLGTSDTASRLWIGYFTDDANTPIDLAIGSTIHAMAVFTPTNVPVTPGAGMRAGIFSYADGATRVAADNFGSGSTGNGANVSGYLLIQNMGTTFSDDTPMSLEVRTNITSGNLMGTEADFQQLGSGPAGYLNQPAFVTGKEYTLELTATRTADTNTFFTTRISGPNLDLSFSQLDVTPMSSRRFDSFGFRTATAATSADRFNFTRFFVEVIDTVPPFRITSITKPDASSAVVTWDSIPSKKYQVQSRLALDSGNWATNATVTASGITASYTITGLGAIPTQFYRIVAVP